MMYTQDRGSSWVTNQPYNASGYSFNVLAMRETANGLRGVAGDLRQNMYYCAGSGCL